MLRHHLARLAAVLALTAPASRAVIVAHDNTATHTTAPAVDDFGFHSTGLVFNTTAGIFATGIHLGDGWVLSAYHNITNGAGGFLFGTVLFGGTGYTVDATTARRLHNPDTSFTDLAVFKLTAVPSTAPAVTLAGVAPAIGTDARMIGNGNDRMAAETQWLVAGSSWTEVPVGGNAAGYKLQPGSQTLRWGVNQIETNPALFAGAGFGPVISFRTDFGDTMLTAPAGEGQATGGDSGGGIFTKNGTQWELSGIMLYTAGFTGQPSATAVYGNLTLAASIPAYKSEIQTIMATVPEPATTAALLLGAAALTATRRRGQCISTAHEPRPPR